MGKFGAVCRGIAETVVASFAAQVAVRGNAEFGCAGIAAAADADIQSFIRNKAVGVVDDRAVFTHVDTVFADRDLIFLAFGHNYAFVADRGFIIRRICNRNAVGSSHLIRFHAVGSDTGAAFDVSGIAVRLADAACIVAASCTAAAAGRQVIHLVFQRFHIYAVKAGRGYVRSIHFTAAQAHAAQLTVGKADTVDAADACHCSCGKIHAAESSCCRFQVCCFQAVFSKAGCAFDCCFTTAVSNIGAFDAFRIGCTAARTATAIVFNSSDSFRQVF